MLSVVTYLWNEGFRDYKPEHVNVEASMFRRHLTVPHRFVCVTDETEGFDEGVTVVRTPQAALDVGRLRSPEGSKFPSCYRRLWTWSDEAKEILGDWILLVDIDLVLLNNINHLAHPMADFVGWRPRMVWGNQKRVAGGLYLLKAGSHSNVWNDFDGAPAIAKARSQKFRGSDQAWISYCVSHKAAIWPEGAGVYSIRDLDNGKMPLPSDARLVQFNGPVKPWQSPLPWVRDAWR